MYECVCVGGGGGWEGGVGGNELAIQQWQAHNYFLPFSSVANYTGLERLL